MARKVGLIVALAFLLTCGPSAVVPSSSPAQSASAAAIASTDLISLREGGQQSGIVVRKVATSAPIRTIPDGLLLPDGVSIITADGGGASTLVKKIDRRTGATVSSRTVDGTWQLYRGYPTFTGSSPDGTRVVLFGSSYNFTEPNGSWTARTTFGVLDLATWKVDPIEFQGRYAFVAVSNDGRSAYVIDYSVVPSQLRVFDVATRAFAELKGEVPQVDTAAPSYIGGSAFMLFSTVESVMVSPDHLQVTPVTKLARVDLTNRSVSTSRLPITRLLSGEEAFAWSLVASRDGKTLYVANPMAGAVHEIDAVTLQVRRTAALGSTQSRRSLVDAALAFLHPVAEAKMGFITGAALSADGATLYVLGAQGLWSVDLAAFTAKVLARNGAYMSLKVSPDGLRLYVLGREDGVVSAIDARTGAVLGSMKRLAFPSDIVAVDAG
jgi:DNA-binding beta-propeller fold protein YncE